MHCPLQSVIFNHISNSYIYKNQLEFLSVNESEDFSMPNVRELTVYVAYEYITTRLIDKNVFKNVVRMHLNGYFYGIQADLFEGFTHLKQVHLSADRIEVLFGEGIKWMQHLNSDLSYDLATNATNASIDLNRAIYVLLYSKRGKLQLFWRSYDYPDADFCFFKDFPHKQLVAPLIDNSRPLICTQAWLFQYAYIFSNVNIYKALRNLMHTNVTACMQQIACNFTQRLAKCSSQKHPLE